MRVAVQFPLVASALSALLLVVDVGRAAEFQIDRLKLTVPEGFTVERIAAAPLVDRPISAAFDERGRLYVTDSAGMTDKADKQLAAKPHRIRRLVDSDGDGIFDHSTLFADRVMFPEGCLWHEGSLYVAAPPEIWKFTDTDDDGIADERTVWHNGKTLTGCGNDLHGPYLGRDGWFYWTKGAYAEQTYALPDGAAFTSRASHIYRARPDGSGFEPVLTGGMANPVGVAFTSTGERFLSCTFFVKPGGGRRDGLIHSIHGGLYGQEREELRGHIATGDLMPLLNHSGASAPCGMIAASRSLFGGGWGDNLLTCYFNLHKVVRHELIPDGATFTTADSDLIHCDDPDFHPTDVIEDADGSLIVVDTGGWYKVCCPTSQLAKPDVLGGIYRLRRTGVKSPNDPRGLKIEWSKQTPAQLAALLSDPRQFVRERSIRELAAHAGDAVPALAKVLTSDGGTAARQDAMWALARIDNAGARRATRAAVLSTEEAVCVAAIQSTGLWRDSMAIPELKHCLAGGTAASRRAAAEALGRIGGIEAVNGLLAATGQLSSAKPGASGAPEQAGERVLEHSLIYALIETREADAIATALDSENAASRRAALVALDQLRSEKLRSGHVTPLLSSSDLTLRRTAAWIVSHRPDWGAQVAEYFEGRLAGLPSEPLERAELSAQLAQLAKSEPIQLLLVSALAKGSTIETRRVALQAMADAGLNPAPVSWLDAIARRLASDGPGEAASVVAAARRLHLPKGGHAGFNTALTAMGRDGAVEAPVRLEALSVTGPLANVDTALFEFLIANLDEPTPLTDRSRAATVLARARLTVTQQTVLADAARTLGPLELPKILPAFERNPSEALGLALVEALKDSTGFRGLRADLIQPLLSKYPETVQRAGAPLLQRLNADAAMQAAQLESALATLPAGDIRRGQSVFLSAKAACAACHQIGYAGGHLGPDLTNIGKIRNERDLLEAILFPNASFVRGYEPFTVATRDGEEHSGILLSEASDELVMATGPQSQERIRRSDVGEIRPGAVSLMPQGMEDVLTPQELADVVAFLKAAQR